MKKKADENLERGEPWEMGMEIKLSAKQRRACTIFDYK